jgi:chromosome segregation ATPase
MQVKDPKTQANPAPGIDVSARPTWSPALGGSAVQTARSGRADLLVDRGTGGRWRWRMVVQGTAGDDANARLEAEMRADAENLLAVSGELIEELIGPNGNAKYLVGEAMKARVHAMLLEHERDALRQEVRDLRAAAERLQAERDGLERDRDELREDGRTLRAEVDRLRGASREAA